MMGTQIEMPEVLRKRLGEDGAAALSEAMQTFWQVHYQELEEAAWHRVEGRLDRIEAVIGRLSEAQDRAGARLDRVEAAIERLTEAQARTEARVESLEEGQRSMQAAIERLTEAQARTEARVESLEEGQRSMQAAIERLTEAQARTEARVESLEEGQRSMQAAIERLAEAQARTEARVESLEEGQRSMQAAIERLAEAQARTDRAVEKLTTGMTALRQEVGALSENVGFGLEGIARITLPGYLERHLEIEVLGPLGEELNPRQFGPEGQEEEFDLYGVGVRAGKDLTIVGEVKSRIYSDDVRRFLERIERVRPSLPDNHLPVLFGYNIHPRAREEAEKVGLLLVAAYQR